MFKSAEFIRRKLKRLAYRIGVIERTIVWVKDAVVAGVHHTVHGLKDFGKDSKWLIKHKIDRPKYSLTSYSQEKKSNLVLADMLKMIPFSAFIIVPGGEILLPAYLKIFPNSLPSQFVSEADRKKKMHDFHKKQMEAADFLAKEWPKRVQNLLDNEHVPEDDKEKIR